MGAVNYKAGIDLRNEFLKSTILFLNQVHLRQREKEGRQRLPRSTVHESIAFCSSGTALRPQITPRPQPRVCTLLPCLCLL